MVIFRISIRVALREEAHISLEFRFICIRDPMHIFIEEESHLPVECQLNFCLNLAQIAPEVVEFWLFW
jgi:hypothetical protein